MKKLGLVGGTGPESTAIYYQQLNKLFNEKTGGKEFPEIIIESINLNKALMFVANEQYHDLELYLTNAIKNLEASGAEIVALTAATMHVVFDRISKKVTVPFISIPETVAEVSVSRGYKKIGLLGTVFTMEKNYLKKAFEDKQIEIVVPSKEERILVNEIISEELEYGIVKESSKEVLITVIEKMHKEENIEAIILGCTELPLTLNQDNCPVDTLDIMDIHIQKLVELMTE